jgi:hypothetical protein
MPYLVALIGYLWVVGGFGWAAAYEKASGRELTSLGKGLVVLLWPLFGLVSAVMETVDAVKEVCG